MSTTQYQQITDTILAALEAGTRPWSSPWRANPMTTPTRANGQPYRGINVILLWAQMQRHEYTRNQWLTYKQASSLGAQVRKGEKGTAILFFAPITKTAAESGEETKFAVARTYHVFNVAQIDNLPSAFTADPEPLPEIERNLRADTTIEATHAIIRHGGNRAYYSVDSDFIQMPDKADFLSTEGYYATLLHELSHWTGHKTRCNRDFGHKFGSEAYAFEELVAELSSAFLCAALQVTDSPRPDHASYIASWIRVLKRDPRAVVTAASLAQKAADFILGQQTNLED